MGICPDAMQSLNWVAGAVRTMRWHERISETDARAVERDVCDMLRLHIERPRSLKGTLSGSTGAITRGLLSVQLLLLISFRLARTKPHARDLRGLRKVDVLRVSKSRTHVLVQGRITWSPNNRHGEQHHTEAFLGRFHPEKKTVVACELFVGKESQRRCLLAGRARTAATDVSVLHRYIAGS